MAKEGKRITDAEFAGLSGNILEISSWGKWILGAFALLTSFAMAQNLFMKTGKVIPKFDSTIDPIISQPQPQNTNQKRYVR